MTETSKKPIIAELKNADIGYGRVPLAKNLSLSIHEGEFLAMVGPNGSGKTTVMKSLLGLLKLQKGQRILLGELSTHSADTRGKISYIPQRMAINPEVPITVKEFLSLKGTRQYSHSDIHEVLKKVKLSDVESQHIGTLSGGQLQRVFVAFALLGKPRLICLDEATEGMDSSSQQEFLKLLKELVTEQNLSLFMISHDISAVTSFADRVLCVNRKILYDGKPGDPDFHTCLHGIYGKDAYIHGHHH